MKEWKGVTEGQWAVLKGRVSRLKSTEENWYIIYSTIFPSAPRPSSPCKYATTSSGSRFQFGQLTS